MTLRHKSHPAVLKKITQPANGPGNDGKAVSHRLEYGNRQTFGVRRKQVSIGSLEQLVLCVALDVTTEGDVRKLLIARVTNGAAELTTVSGHGERYKGVLTLQTAIR